MTAVRGLGHRGRGSWSGGRRRRRGCLPGLDGRKREGDEAGGFAGGDAQQAQPGLGELVDGGLRDAFRRPLAHTEEPEHAADRGAERDLGIGNGEPVSGLPGLDVLDIPGGLAPRALRDIEAGQATGRFTVPDAEIALSAVAGGLLGLLRMCQRRPERVDETAVDQLAEAELRLLGVPADEAARLVALSLPAIEGW